MAFGNYDIRFVTQDGCLRVCEVVEGNMQNWKKVK
jgi:hypothetical protein